MFTGLIETLGTISSLEKRGSSIIMGIEPDLPVFDVNDGGSVAIDGACLTVECKKSKVIYFSAVRETLQRTTLASPFTGRRVNMERAMQVSGRLDGHLVSGHIDGLGTIVQDHDVQGSVLRTIAIPEELQPFMAEKGSVAIDGVSLTIAKSTVATITISFIPATIQKTTMLIKRAGDHVNIECDLIARYLYRFQQFSSDRKTNETAGLSLLKKMEGLGF
jgi:riboflavin synthase alpha subunit